MIDFIVKKQIYDSVMTGKVNASNELNCTVSMLISPSAIVLTSVLCLVMHILCVNALKLLSGLFWHFWGQDLAFFGEYRLATLVPQSATQ